MQEQARNEEARNEEARKRNEQALSDAVAAILTADDTLAPSRVLRALDVEDGTLGVSGPYAYQILNRAGHAAIENAELLYNARMEA